MSKQIRPPELTYEKAGLWGMSEYKYHRPIVYRNGKVDMVRFPGGYATIRDGEVTFHYYTQDYLGSNRAVINGSTGAVEQTVAYYPYGAVIADLGSTSDPQPYKFGGKELTLQNVLNECEFGARQYYPAVPYFTSVDPLCEKYYWLSPYLYCGNNPVNAVDPTGMDWSIWSERDNENILNIHMQINGVVYNSFKNSIDVDKLSTEIKSQLEDVFSFSGDGYKVNLEANIRSVSDVNDIKETDHVFVIAKQEKIGKDNVLAKATTNGLTIKLGTTLANQIISGENTRSIAHELGHTGGLSHPDHPSSVQVNDKNTNLMTQIKGLDSGVDYNHARNLQPNQLNVIIRNYNEGKLNLGSPVSKISHFRVSSSFPFFHLHSNILNF